MVYRFIEVKELTDHRAVADVFGYGAETVILGNAADVVLAIVLAQMPSKELFSFKTHDGVELNGWIMKPANFNSSKKYPVIMHQYSGPGSQEVADKWGIGARRDGGMFEAYMAGQGFIMACVDAPRRACKAGLR